MSKKISKEAILTACIEKQEELVSSYEHRVKEMTDDAYGHTQSASQSEDRTAGKIELLQTLKNELEFVTAEMSFLKSLDPGIKKDTIETGAVVVTDQRTFFVAVSSEKVEAGGQEVFGLSPNAPIYSVMKGLKDGNAFSFNDIDYKIISVY
ncbi:MAG: hypothetical protein ABIT96_03165 [Ferruginibacter sp.]